MSDAASFVVESAMIAHALKYAAVGWRVIPLHNVRGGACTCQAGAECKSPGKHPRVKDWVNAGTCDPDQIRDWWRKWPQANVGVVTGVTSGIVVLDVDVKDGGMTSLGELCDEFGQFEETVEADTGSGGLHVVFAHPGRYIRGGAGLKSWLDRPGLDFRGDGGMFVVSPSMHACGQRYAWRFGQSPFDVKPKPMPEWLLAIHDAATEPPPAANHHDRPPRRPSGSEPTPSEHWLGKALARVTVGNRNDTGLWMACQLRDANVPRGEAERAMLDYAERCPRGDRAYGADEALASLEQAYKRPAREGAKSKASIYDPKFRHVRQPKREQVDGEGDAESSKGQQPAQGELRDPEGDAADELEADLEGVIDGRIYNLPLPWEMLTDLTQCGLPGSTTLICGDPGIGKTYLVLQMLQFFVANGFDPAVFFVEKNRKFHTRRLLAQLENNSGFVFNKWVRENADLARAAMQRHRYFIQQMGQHIWSAPLERVTLPGLLEWVRKMADAGHRAIIIDPITAVKAGERRWDDDDTFALGAEKILEQYGTSLFITTHPKQGKRSGAPSPNDMAGGAAYNRFVDTNVWIYRSAKFRRVRVQNRVGGVQTMKLDLFALLHKTRSGRGGGSQIAMTFGEGLAFAEQGIVLKDLPDDQEDAV
jgi:KaiC/GvpD/RAD55 family RecA-like ATPase